MKEFKVVEGRWEIAETTRLFGLTLQEGAEIVAPEGKQVTLVYNGENIPIIPGQYEGDVVLEVTDDLVYLDEKFRAAVVLQDGAYVPEKSVTAAAIGGEISGQKVSGIEVTSMEEAVTAIFASIPENGETVVENVTLNMIGNGGNDFAGYGAAIAASGKGKLTINNSSITTKGAARGAIYAGESVELEVNDTKIRTKGGVLNADYTDTIKTKNPGVMRRVPWMLGLRGNCRATNLLDYANATYNRCDISADGWGVMSTDGVKKCRMSINDSNLHIDSGSGYGALSIGDCVVTYDNTTVSVPDYGMILLMGISSGVIKNGSTINSGRFGTMSSMNTGLVTVQDATIKSKETTFMVRGCSTEFDVSNSVLESGNGIILQVMNGDDPGNPQGYYIDPEGPDTPIEGRDLTAAEKRTDVVAAFSNMTIKGDFYNGTSNLDGDTGGANLLAGGPGAGAPGGDMPPMGGGMPPMGGGMPPMGGDMPPMGGGMPPMGGNMPPMGGGMPPMGGNMPPMGGGMPPMGGGMPPMGGGMPPMGGDMPPMGGGMPPMGGDMPPMGGDMPGGFSMPSFGGPNAKNLELTFTAVDLTGCISSTVSRHRVEKVCKECCEELGEVVNTPEQAINNGVIVNLNAGTKWTVTATCYLNKLVVADGVTICTADGKAPVLVVDGVETELKAGTYTGALQLIP